MKNYGWLSRFVRVAVSLIVSWAVAYYSKEAWFIALAPFLSAISKYLRDKGSIDLVVI